MGRRNERIEPEAAGVPVPQPQTPPDEPQGISYVGVFGGALGCGTLLLIAVAFAGSNRAYLAFVYGALAALFVPAIIASQVDTPRRRQVLRASTIAAILIAFLSLPIDYGVTFIMAPATVVLAQAAGYVFQGRTRS